jgi:hypothetical protein
MGTIFLIYPLSSLNGNLKLNTIQVSINQSDYVFNKNLSKISENGSNYYRLCLKVLTTRYYFNSSNQTFSVLFNESGTFKLDIYMYDKNMNFAYNTTIANIKVGESNFCLFRFY